MSVVLPKPVVPKHWVLDANILFSEWTRWLCQTLADHHGCTLYWTDQIEDECFRNLIRLGRLHAEDAKRDRACLAARHGATRLDVDYQPYCADVRAVHEKDRHVAATALALRHQVQSPVALLTWNLKDFPRKQLLKLGVVRFNLDELCVELCPSAELIQNTLNQTNELMVKGLLNTPPQFPTPFQIKASPLPVTADDWQVFLARNKMHRTAKKLMADQNITQVG